MTGITGIEEHAGDRLSWVINYSGIYEFEAIFPFVQSRLSARESRSKTSSGVGSEQALAPGTNLPPEPNPLRHISVDV